MIKSLTDKVVKRVLGDTEAGPVSVDQSMLRAMLAEPDLRNVGLFSDVREEKVAEIVQAMIYLNELNKMAKDPKAIKPIKFYLSTYGGSADDMFALYDIMRVVQHSSEIHTIGVGKVMSAGVLLLAGGTKGRRFIGANCRVMIHSVIAGSHGPLHNLLNEMEAIETLQQDYTRVLVENTKMTESQVRKMLERKVNIYLDAEEAVRLGIADVIF